MHVHHEYAFYEYINLFNSKFGELAYLYLIHISEYEIFIEICKFMKALREMARLRQRHGKTKTEGQIKIYAHCSF